jgi:tight adherence protein B
VIGLALGALGVVATIALLTAARRAAAVDRVRRLRSRPRWSLPEPGRAALARALARADIELTPEDALRWWLTALAAAAAMAGAISPVASVVVGVGVLAGAPAALWWARGRADARVVAGLPRALDRVAAGLRAGSTVPDGLRGLATTGGPLGPDLRRVDARTRLGAGLADALSQWTRDRPVPAVRAVAGSLALALSVGGACAGALEGLGESLRMQEATVREARALSAQTRLSAVVVGAAPLAYLAFVTIADPGSLDALLATGPGQVCLVVGLALEVLAALWMRALLRSTV